MLTHVKMRAGGGSMKITGKHIECNFLSSSLRTSAPFLEEFSFLRILRKPLEWLADKAGGVFGVGVGVRERKPRPGFGVVGVR